ncbi:MAG: ASKHA domain-containing protein [Verrucomicrobiota bacterium]|nr:ASKHA domain-containing protein [Verrucomicrobiota bacterium]MDP7049478.1 ASKHA domain-containing protein [Verrucomicrobiota bacterium]
MSVTVQIDSHRIESDAGVTLFGLAKRMNVRIPTSCSGNGNCRECLVEIAEGGERLSARTSEEDHLQGDFRLSCRATVEANSGEIHCHTLQRGAIQIEERGVCLPCLDKAPPLGPAVTRDGDRVLLDGEEIDRTTGPLHGLAVDLGTTTVSLRLVDLETGRVKASQSFENPQRFGGSDVLARVKFDTDQGGRLLRRTLAGYMSRAIESFGVPAGSIYEVVLVGNPVMCDLFFGLDVYPLGQMPYRSVTEQAFRDGQRPGTHLAKRGKQSLLPIHPDGRVYILPLIGSHVGSDMAACLLSTGLAREERTVAVMDIGTNTELVIGNRHKLQAASCPAGPAFEGGQIQCGMPALEGAIERVQLEPEWELGVIGGGRPTGLCGSGLIDLLGELLRIGRINSCGRFTDDSDRFWIDAENDVYLTEEDISQLAQAKAANVAGLHLLHQNYGIDFSDLDVFYLAGGFARHIDLGHARRIGLIPDLPDERIVQVGNAALEGATLALLSVAAREEIDQLVRRIEHVELETFPEFFHCFAEGAQFVPFQTRATEPIV